MQKQNKESLSLMIIKTLLVFLLLMGISVVIISWGYIVGEYSKNGENKIVKIVDQEETNNDDQFDTSDWQTYRNEEFGFEVKYPEKYKIYDYADKIIDTSPTVKEHNDPIANFTKEGQHDITAYIEYWGTKEGHLNFHKSEPDFIIEINNGGYIVIDYSPGVNYPVPSELKKEWEIILSTFKFIEEDYIR